MPRPSRFRIATLMMLVALVALVVALARREREVRRLRAELDVARQRLVAIPGSGLSTFDVIPTGVSSPNRRPGG